MTTNFIQNKVIYFREVNYPVLTCFQCGFWGLGKMKTLITDIQDFSSVLTIMIKKEVDYFWLPAFFEIFIIGNSEIAKTEMAKIV